VLHRLMLGVVQSAVKTLKSMKGVLVLATVSGTYTLVQLFYTSMTVHLCALLPMCS
jgi:hypothetical protein